MTPAQGGIQILGTILSSSVVPFSRAATEQECGRFLRCRVVWETKGSKKPDYKKCTASLDELLKPFAIPPQLFTIKSAWVFGPPWRRRRPDGWTSSPRASRGATAETRPDSQRGNVSLHSTLLNECNNEPSSTCQSVEHVPMPQILKETVCRTCASASDFERDSLSNTCQCLRF